MSQILPLQVNIELFKRKHFESENQTNVKTLTLRELKHFTVTNNF